MTSHAHRRLAVMKSHFCSTVNQTSTSTASQSVVSANTTDVVLNNGFKMPIVGLGTFLSKPGEVGAAVETALRAGYRHIDCAARYKNEKEVGDALTRVFNDPGSGIRREDVFITTKLCPTKYHPDQVADALAQQLKDLQVDYIDLYLLHHAVACRYVGDKPEWLPRAGFSFGDTWKAMEACYRKGSTRAIGVSNFGSQLINNLVNGCEVMPAVNQIELHPYLAQPEFVNYMHRIGIHVTAYAPLGAPGKIKQGVFKAQQLDPLLSAPVVKAIADKHKVTTAQVLIRWHIDNGVVVIPKSVNPHRIKSNFAVFHFALDATDLSQLKKLDRNLRTFSQDWIGIPVFA